MEASGELERRCTGEWNADRSAAETNDTTQHLRFAPLDSAGLAKPLLETISAVV
jgi:hypothetical protein